jgi:ribonuclease BN (tRNA processing enzyme)
MRVELLPSSFTSDRRAGSAQFLSSYVVGDSIAIDAGSIGLLDDVERQRRIRHVFLTHGHLDHVASLPLLLENVFEPGRPGVEVIAENAVLQQVRRDLFNGNIWPDFFELSTSAGEFARATPIERLETVERAGCRVTSVPVSHSCPTNGFVVDDGSACVAFAADTGPTDLLWRHLAERDRLRAVFLECSFPASLADLATRCGHLSTKTFAHERARLPADVRTIVVHRKPAHAERIAAELTGLGLPNVALVEPGLAYDF